MRCEPQETVILIEGEVRYYHCPSLFHNQLIRRVRRERIFSKSGLWHKRRPSKAMPRKEMWQQVRDKNLASPTWLLGCELHTGEDGEWGHSYGLDCLSPKVFAISKGSASGCEKPFDRNACDFRSTLKESNLGFPPEGLCRNTRAPSCGRSSPM